MDKKFLIVNPLLVVVNKVVIVLKAQKRTQEKGICVVCIRCVFTLC